MKTIRRGTFETNSSSCHSITIECTKKEVDEFNAGKRFYYWNYTRDSFIREEAFLTIEELYERLENKVKNTDILDRMGTYNDCYDASNYGVNYCSLPWDCSKEEYVEKDFENFKKYFKENLCLDMFKFAMIDDYESTKYFSKVLLRSFIQSIFNEDGCPVMTIENLRNTHSSSFDSSDVYWNPNGYSRKTTELEIYDKKLSDDSKIRVNIDIRDN